MPLLHGVIPEYQLWFQQNKQKYLLHNLILYLKDMKRACVCTMFEE